MEQLQDVIFFVVNWVDFVEIVWCDFVWEFFFECGRFCLGWMI